MFARLTNITQKYRLDILSDTFNLAISEAHLREGYYLDKGKNLL